jgi:hypothetical protein
MLCQEVKWAIGHAAHFTGAIESTLFWVQCTPSTRRIVCINCSLPPLPRVSSVDSSISGSRWKAFELISGLDSAVIAQKVGNENIQQHDKVPL